MEPCISFTISLTSNCLLASPWSTKWWALWTSDVVVGYSSCFCLDRFPKIGNIDDDKQKNYHNEISNHWHHATTFHSLSRFIDKPTNQKKLKQSKCCKQKFAAAAFGAFLLLSWRFCCLLLLQGCAAAQQRGLLPQQASSRRAAAPAARHSRAAYLLEYPRQKRKSSFKGECYLLLFHVTKSITFERKNRHSGWLIGLKGIGSAFRLFFFFETNQSHQRPAHSHDSVAEQVYYCSLEHFLLLERRHCISGYQRSRCFESSEIESVPFHMASWPWRQCQIEVHSSRWHPWRCERWRSEICCKRESR